MKKISTLLAFAALALTATAQIPEPDFVGEAIVVNADGSHKKLEKQTVLTRTRANAGIIVAGIGHVKTLLIIDGTSSGTQLDGGDDFKFIIKAADNESDPMSIIRIFRFKTDNVKRKAEMSSTSTFGSTKSNKLDYMTFSAKKYGERSYLIIPESKEPGEYGIIVTNPNDTDEKQVIVSTFGIKGAEIIPELQPAKEPAAKGKSREKRNKRAK